MTKAVFGLIYRYGLRAEEAGLLTYGHVTVLPGDARRQRDRGAYHDPYRLAITVQKGEEHFGKGACAVCLRRDEREETMVLGRDDITLGGRRRQTAQRIKAVAEKLGGGAME